VSVTVTAKFPLTILGATRTFPMVGELDGVADQIEQYLGEALFIAKAKGQGLRDMGARTSILFCATDSVAERTLSTTLSIA